MRPNSRCNNTKMNCAGPLILISKTCSSVKVEVISNVIIYSMMNIVYYRVMSPGISIKHSLAVIKSMTQCFFSISIWAHCKYLPLTRTHVWNALDMTSFLQVMWKYLQYLCRCRCYLLAFCHLPQHFKWRVCLDIHSGDG